MRPHFSLRAGVFYFPSELFNQKLYNNRICYRGHDANCLKLKAELPFKGGLAFFNGGKEDAVMKIIIGIILSSLLVISSPYFGDELNLGTGDYIMDMGGGDKLNTGTGDYIMDLD